MAAPTVNEYDESAVADSGATDELSSSASWIAGDIVLVFGGVSDNAAAGMLATPTVSGGTGTGLTFSLSTSINNASGSNDTTVFLWTATAAGTGSGQIASVTSAAVSTSMRALITVFVCRGATALGTPVTLDGQNAKTISVVTTQANSIVCWMMLDWAQVGDVTVTATPSGTVRHASAQSGQADFFSGNTDDLVTVASHACGIANHTGTVDMSGIAIEVLGTAAGGTNPKGPLGNPFFGPFGGAV